MQATLFEEMRFGEGGGGGWIARFPVFELEL